jgi:uncharacterized integral membrane protein
MSEEQAREPAPRDERRRQLRIAGFVVLGVVGLVFVLQNTGSTKISLLWLHVEMPLFLVLVAMVALGLGLGQFSDWRKRRR